MWEIIFTKIWGVYELEIRLAGVELITPNLDALAEAIKKNNKTKQGCWVSQRFRGISFTVKKTKS